MGASTFHFYSVGQPWAGVKAQNHYRSYKNKHAALLAKPVSSGSFNRDENNCPLTLRLPLHMPHMPHRPHRSHRHLIPRARGLHVLVLSSSSSSSLYSPEGPLTRHQLRGRRACALYSALRAQRLSLFSHHTGSDPACSASPAPLSLGGRAISRSKRARKEKAAFRSAD